jgi:type II secretory pathway pseudopilin PulG
MDELDQLTTRYLLGELSEQEQAALEQSYFRDRNVFNEVLKVESDLVDAYARGQLSAEIRERFERSYLNHPARRKRVEFARALTSRIDEREQSVTQPARSASSVSWWRRLLALVGAQGPPLRFAMATIIVLIAVAGVWIFVNTRRQQQREAAQLQARQEEQLRRAREQVTPQQPTETPKQEERVAQIPPETSQPSPNSNTNSAPPIVSLALTVGGVRGTDNSATQTLVIPHDTPQAQLLLNLKDDSYPRYRVSLRKIDGAEILTQTNIRPRSTNGGARFVFKVPARLLTSGEYALTLGGITSEGEVDDLSKSLFRVEKK